MSANNLESAFLKMMSKTATIPVKLIQIVKYFKIK